MTFFNHFGIIEVSDVQDGPTPRRQVMDYKLIQGSLDWWQTDEIFFRDYYEAIAGAGDAHIEAYLHVG